ncbi:MAG TPA: AMMECR1 family protein, partial [bacterium]|nr:AMMECR1 family protein [bacterium]
MTPLANLAKQAVETYITTKKIIKPPKNFPSAFLKKRAGVFVTIEEKDQELRGCIGTYLPVRNNIAEETIYNAIAAATEDYRFMPIQKSELPNLTYTVSILGQPEQILDI